MSEYRGFFDKGEDDTPVYEAAVFAKFMRLFKSTGVVFNFLNDLEVEETGSGLSVYVNTGGAIIEGYPYLTDAQLTKNIDAQSAGTNRIDRIVVRRTAASKTVEVAVLKGTAAASPVAPVLTQTDSVYEISLAQVYVAGGAVNLTSANITDERTYADPASDILTKLKTVDGAGSGLDADKLNGQEGSYYRPKNPAAATGDSTSGAYWRSLQAGTYFNVNGTLANAPSPYGFVILENLTSDNFFVLYHEQATGSIWHTSGNSDTVTCTWIKVWDASNDGAGSGSDADMVDGTHASGFATATQGTKADNALPKDGGNMTGDINFAVDTGINFTSSNGNTYSLKIGNDKLYLTENGGLFRLWTIDATIVT